MNQNATKQRTNPVLVTPDRVAAAMERTVKRVRQMSHQQRVESLKDAGILTAAGELATRYR